MDVVSDKKQSEKIPVYRVDTEWLAEDEVFGAGSKDIPGLVLEAPTEKVMLEYISEVVLLMLHPPVDYPVPVGAQIRCQVRGAIEKDLLLEFS